MNAVYSEFCTGKTQLAHNECHRRLIAQLLRQSSAKAKRIVFVTGAGISYSCGIPVSMQCMGGERDSDLFKQDFHLSNGLYALVKE